jgi:SAM-dependent methyltransferase
VVPDEGRGDVSDPEKARYTFGDSAPASARLARVARVFAPTTTVFLARAARDPARIIDLGCGPGHTTRLLADTFPAASVTGLDRSDAFLEEAGRGAPSRVRFVRADVATTPLPGGPADLVFARFVLSHLPERAAALRGWLDTVARGGVLAIEEVDRIDTDDPVFAEYLGITSGLMADRGGALYVGRQLGATARALGEFVVVDMSATVEPATAESAGIFALNLASWRDDPWVVDHHGTRLDALAAGLREREGAPGGGRIRWTLRQVAIAR